MGVGDGGEGEEEKGRGGIIYSEGDKLFRNNLSGG